MTATAHHPGRFARAVRAACNSYGDMPLCEYPTCTHATGLCWLGDTIEAYRAAIEEWEKPQRLGHK